MFNTSARAFVEVVIDILNKSANIKQAKQAIEILKINERLLNPLKVQAKDHSQLTQNKDQREVTITEFDQLEKLDIIYDDDQTVKLTQNTADTTKHSEEEAKELTMKAEDSHISDDSSNENTKESESIPEQEEIQDQNRVKLTDKDNIISNESNQVETVNNISEKNRLDEESRTNESQDLSLLEMQESLNELIKKEDRVLFKELESIVSEQKAHQIEGELHINNAGLILLHPYLKDFFKHCELLDDENKICNKDLAVHLLHYLATKQEQQFENNMLFEKVLCGVPIEEPIQRTIPLSEELKANAEELLEAVLANWGVLKNASPDLLRGEFLQRFGKISFKEANPKITVERKVQDILLDKLPWNVGISRLPWLDYLLFTDW